MQPAPRLQAGAATCGKAWRGGLGCRVAIRSPTEGSPSLSWRGGVQQTGKRAPRLRRLLPSPACTRLVLSGRCSPSPRGPRSEGARPQLRRPGSGSGGIRQATARRGTGRKIGVGGGGASACSLLSRIYCHGGLQKSSRTIRRRPMGCASRGRRRSSARRLGWEPASRI